MRIINSVLGDASGGRWQVVCQYSRLLVDAGHRVAMLLDSRYGGDPTLIPGQVELLVVRNRGHYDYAAAWRVRGVLRAFAPDIAVAHCSRSVALLKRALGGRVPLLAVSHSNKVSRLLPADAWIALTRHIEARLMASPVSKGKRCFVIPNMIAVEPTRPLPGRPANQPPRIGALGRFDRVKGFDVLLTALAELQSQGCAFEALLAGAGSEGSALRAQAGRLGLEQHLHMPGWVTDVPGFLAGLDVLCVPARSDAFGLTPLQGAVAGVPLLLSRASGHQEMFSADSEALFCEVDDAHSTACQLQRLLERPALAEGLRQAAYKRVVGQYSAQAVSDQILQAIESTVNYPQSR